ncbi:hypothetical protein JZ751_010627 [Albula glossodonta]|uniref:Uncharacterized protein n=1 Tax=Albula glossodonta TaxID=121402 RepID=A0A8T2MTT9_9TELE|nr:hypothetical protein JZ751_010627 [Albula glossodonta]
MSRRLRGQLSSVAYLLKTQDLKTRQGPDLLQSLIKYFQAQLNTNLSAYCLPAPAEGPVPLVTVFIDQRAISALRVRWPVRHCVRVCPTAVLPARVGEPQTDGPLRVNVFFQDGLKAAEHIGPFVEKLAASVHTDEKQPFIRLKSLYRLSRCAVNATELIRAAALAALLSGPWWFTASPLSSPLFQKSNHVFSKAPVLDIPPHPSSLAPSLRPALLPSPPQESSLIQNKPPYSTRRLRSGPCEAGRERASLTLASEQEALAKGDEYRQVIILEVSRRSRGPRERKPVRGARRDSERHRASGTPAHFPQNPSVKLTGDGLQAGSVNLIDKGTDCSDWRGYSAPAFSWLGGAGDPVFSVQVRQDQDEDVRQLSQLRDSLRTMLQVEGKEAFANCCLTSSDLLPWPVMAWLGLKPPGVSRLRPKPMRHREHLNRKNSGNSGNGYSIHQPQGNKKYGTEKSGFLLKKSDGRNIIYQLIKRQGCGSTWMCSEGGGIFGDPSPDLTNYGFGILAIPRGWRRGLGWIRDCSWVECEIGVGWGPAGRVGQGACQTQLLLIRKVGIQVFREETSQTLRLASAWRQTDRIWLLLSATGGSETAGAPVRKGRVSMVGAAVLESQVSVLGYKARPLAAWMGLELPAKGEIRKVWQKRKCGVKYGCLTISHSTINRPPAKLNLLTCQVRPNPDEKRTFDLVTRMSSEL